MTGLIFVSMEKEKTEKIVWAKTEVKDGFLKGESFFFAAPDVLTLNKSYFGCELQMLFI